MKYQPPIGAAEDAPYIDANVPQGIEGSPVPAAAIEHPQREILNAIQQAGLTPDGADLTQLGQAILNQRVALATASETLAGASVTKAVCPAGLLALHAQQIGSSGWIIFPPTVANGPRLTFQWINANTTWSGSPLQGVITLPIAFANRCLFAWADDYNADPGASTFITMRWVFTLGNLKTTIGFESSANPSGFTAFAIGY